MPGIAAQTKFELPSTIAGLWAVCALVPFRTRPAYQRAADLCGKLAVRRLTTVQREYFRELQALVEAYEDQNGEAANALAQLTRLARS